ncbi:reverse transcriptase-like protein [Pseudoduganella sp. FT93W]|uniref:Reverse transcriptase-like protein n=1 Tax=Duganella fentianensis TaxID=2692177 RepID=A0A845I1G0_9BURK|nr:reverse transcriptase-like protein [Duganella fentianensis]MYN44936.1 reverse transcriptase-like protein [Duganella fentianensis]
MSDTADQQLQQLAYKTERAAAARLAARQQLAPAQALRQVLTLAAGQAGLAQLVADRQAQQQRSELRAQARNAALAQRSAQRQAACATSAPHDAQDSVADVQVWQGWFDGSAVPNPGRMGIGALLCGPQGQTIRISQPAGYGNSSEAEYLALTALLQAAVQAGVTQLSIRGDSQVVVNDVNLTPQAIAAGQGAAVLTGHRQEVCALMAQIGKVELRWLPRHRNAAADQLAQQALKLRPPAP